MSSLDFWSMYLLRHGLSVWNLSKRWQGQQNPELSKEGAKLVEQWADAVMRQENDLAFWEIWSSDLKRASQTAEIIGKQLDIPITVDERLRERALGAWEGLTRQEIEAEWPGDIERRAFPEGSESDEQVIGRVLEGLDEKMDEKMGAKKESSVLIVSHGGVITCLEEFLGSKWAKLKNLNGRWVYANEIASKSGRAYSLGERTDYLSRSASSSGSS